MGASQSGPKITAQDRAILDLKLQRDKLKQFQKRIENVLGGEKEAARTALAAGNKPRALIALRRRKYQEQLLTQTDKQLATLQDLVSSIEFSLVEKDVLFGLKQGNSVLKELNREMSIENVEKLMGETADAIAYQKEVDEMLATRMSVEDEEDVQAEVAAMEAEIDATRVPKLPSVPQTELSRNPIREDVGTADEQEYEEEPEGRVAIPA
ncbi:Vacuolar protein sorting-associated protein 20 [Cystobasidiomycetes sp. EMM_F5]